MSQSDHSRHKRKKRKKIVSGKHYRERQLAHKSQGKEEVEFDMSLDDMIKRTIKKSIREE